MTQAFEKEYTAFFCIDSMGACGGPHPDRTSAQKKVEEDEELLGFSEESSFLFVTPLSPDPNDGTCDVTGKPRAIEVRIADPYAEGCGFTLCEEVARDLYGALGRALGVKESA